MTERSPSAWRRTIFFDEKRFCLDGPDGTAKYWNVKRFPRSMFHKRKNGGGGIMVWGGISHPGKTPLVFIDATMDAVGYVSMLEQNLEPFY